MPVLNVTSFWLFAIATSIFSALNERELRQRRADLQALVDVGAKLDAVADAIQQSRSSSTASSPGSASSAASSSANRTAGSSSSPPTAQPDPPTASTDPDWIVRRSWERREILPGRSSLDPDRDPLLVDAPARTRATSWWRR